MNMKKRIAMLLALCLALLGPAGALAEEGALNDLLGFFERASAQGEAAPEPEAPAVDIQPVPDDGGLNQDWQNILLLGTDSRTSETDTRTDTMIILSLNTRTNEIRMTSLMRDIWVEIPGHGGSKLNAACVYGGPELTLQTVNQNFGMDIQSYVEVNMQCLAQIVDALGGIRMDVSDSEAKAINKLFNDDRNAHDENTYFAGDAVSAGSQVLLNGKQALAFVRIRSMDNDYMRTDRQRQMLVAVAKDLQQKDLLTMGTIVTGMLQYVKTNLDFEAIMAIASVCMGASLDDLPELRLPVEGTYQSGTFNGTWCIKPDFEENARQLRAFIYGE